MNHSYRPKPIDTGDITLSEDLLQLSELLAENTHAVWAAGRLRDGWRYGPCWDQQSKTTPCLVPYAQLPEREKDYDRNTALQTIKLLLRLGYRILPPASSWEKGQVEPDHMQRRKEL